MADHSDIQSQRESSVQSTNQQRPDRHELPSLDHQSSICSFTLDDFHCTFSDGTMSFGSVNMDELLNNILTAEEIQASAQHPAAECTALNTVSTMAAATINISPQVPEAPLSQKTVDEVWSEIQKSKQEPEHVSTGCTANVQKVGSSQQRTTFGEMTLEEFLVKAGVVRGQGRPTSAVLKQSCDNQNNDSTALGSGPPGHVAMPAIVIEGPGNVPEYPSRPQSSVRDAASVAVGRIPSRYQPGEVRNEGRRQNRTSGCGHGQGNQSPPVNPISSEGQQNSVNQTGMQIDGGHRQNALVERVVSRRQKRLMKNRESAARSRARKQAYTVELEAELKDLKEEHAHLTQAVEKKKRQEQELMQYMKEKMKTQKAKDRKIGMSRSRSRSRSWPY